MHTWACAVTFWHQQEDVIEQLIKAQLEYFFPRIKRTVRHRGRRVHRLDPLLFNYLPVCLSHQDAESNILNMRGVADMIGPVREHEIQKLRAQCDTDGVMVKPRAPRFAPGQQVYPQNNSLLVGAYVGEVSELEVALFDILGAKRSLKFAVGELAAV